MPTVRLVPSAYTRSNTSRVTVTDPSNMYYNTDHTSNYCTIRGRNSMSNTYYAFIHGFNFGDIPSNATINSFSIKIRAYKSSNLQQGTSYRPRLASSQSYNSAISNTTLSSDVTTTSGGTAYTFPNGNLNWNTLSGYGSNFSIEIPLRSSSSSYPYMYVYGAEIEVDYSLPYTISVSGAAGSSSYNVSGDGEVSGGSNATITFQAQTTGHIIDSLTDNGNDVTNNVVSIGGDQFTYTINNVQEDHALVVHFRAPNYNVTSSFTGPGNISPTGTRVLNPGDNYTLTMTPGDPNNVMVTLTDNGVDVTSQITESGEVYSYTITNIYADHNLIVTFKDAYSITSTLNGNGTLSQDTLVAQGDSYDFIITPTYFDGSTITIIDNGNDVTSSLVNHTTYYTYTINSINSNHNLVVTIVSPLVVVFELNNVDVGVNAYRGDSTSGTSIRNDGQYLTVQPGENIRIGIYPGNGVYCQILKNNIDITDTAEYVGLYGRFEYVLSNIRSDQHITISQLVAAQKTVTFSVNGNNGYFTNTSNTTIQTLTVEQGHVAEFLIAGLYQNTYTTTVPYGTDGLISLVLNGNIDISNNIYFYNNKVIYQVPIFEDSTITMTTDIIYDWVEVYYSSTQWSRTGSHSMVYDNTCQGLIGYKSSSQMIFKQDAFFYISARFIESSYDPDPQYPQTVYPYRDNLANFKYKQSNTGYNWTSYNDHALQQTKLLTYCYFDLSNFDFINAETPNYLQIEVDCASNPKSFNVTTELSGSGTISPSSTNITQLGSYVLTITPNNSLDVVTVTDQYYDVTKNLTNNSGVYTYTLNDINRDHYYRATISESLGYTVINTITGKGTISNNTNVLPGDSTTITITPTYLSVSTVTVIDNGNNVTNLLVQSGNGYLYTINSVDENHTIDATIVVPTFNITNSIVGAGTISSSSVVEYGDTKTITITPTNISFSNVTLIDNGVDVSSQLVNTGSAYTYTLSDIQTNHTISATITTVSSYQITTSISGNGSITPSTTTAEGSNFLITITPSNMNTSMVILTDNMGDVSNSLVNTGSAYTYTITNIHTDHTIVATITAIPEVVDWKIKVPTQTRDINSNGTWSSIDTPYYKMNNSWITPEKVYYKHGGNWLLVWPKNNNKLIMQADFQNSLACKFYLDNTTSNFSIASNAGSISSSGLSLNGSRGQFAAAIQLPTNTLSFFTSQRDIWFTAYVTFSNWGTGWRSGSNNGFSSTIYVRDSSIHNFFEFNNPTFYSRPDTTIPNNSPRWAKFKLDTNGYMIAQLWENNTWVTCRQNTGETNKSLWLHNFSYMGLHQCTEAGDMLISYFRVWNDEPTDAEIGIQ